MTKKTIARIASAPVLGQVIRKWRILSDFTLRHAAKMIGVSPATLMRIEIGHHPDGVTLTKILFFLLKRR